MIPPIAPVVAARLALGLALAAVAAWKFWKASRPKVIEHEPAKPPAVIEPPAPAADDPLPRDKRGAPDA